MECEAEHLPTFNESTNAILHVILNLVGTNAKITITIDNASKRDNI